MPDILLILLCVLMAANLIVVILLLLKSSQNGAEKTLASIESVDRSLQRVEGSLKDEFFRNREEMNRASKETREELSSSFHAFGDSISGRMTQIADLQNSQLDSFSVNLRGLTDTNDTKLSSLTDTLGKRLESFQERLEASVKASRDEMTRSLDAIRGAVETKLASIQNDNNEKLERMRETVDEKLHKTLEDRLGKSFQIVSDRLEAVQRAMGEVQTLANGVGDLKKVLSNVKTRGTLGEYRLEMILEQILAPEQYQRDVVTKPGSRENVEFAILIPSKDAENTTLWLPVDSKFPQDRYQTMLDAYDSGDANRIDAAVKDLERAIKGQAKDIRDKYVNPPLTTDFAIMFLPFEGLYAEVVKRPDLFESLQRDFKVNVVGPSTFAAFVHSLQMGFRTLAIQKRTSEVWSVLGAVKTEFGKFGTVLDGVHRNLEAAGTKILQASQRSRAIERKLRGVEALPQEEVGKFLGESSDLEGDAGGSTSEEGESEESGT